MAVSGSEPFVRVVDSTSPDSAERVAVIGCGTWGTTLAILLAAKGLPVSIWCRGPDEAMALRSERRNVRRLPDAYFPPMMSATASLAEACAESTLAIVVVPAQTVRANCQLLREFLPSGTAVLSCAKGLELGTSRRMSEVIAEEIPEAKDHLAVLSGPNLAPEIAAGLPAASVVAARDGRLAARVRGLLSTPSFRVYTNSDVVGVELGGALKNIIALGAGFCDGLRLGDNAKAAFIGRGLLEIARLGVAAGAQPLTFAGLAGVGDVIATCASGHSRNRLVGEQLALGTGLAQIQARLGMVAEGIATTAAARDLAHRYGVEMPIVEETYQVLTQGKSPRAAMVELMTRDLKDEFAGIGPVAS